MKRFVLTIALTCAFSGVALAGDIPSVPGAPPPPAMSSSSAGDMPTGDFAQQISNEAKLIVLRTIFSLFAR